MYNNLRLKILCLLGVAILACCCSHNDNGFYKSPLVKKNLRLQKVGQFTIHDTPIRKYKIGKLRFDFVSNNNSSLFAFYDEIKRRFVVTGRDGRIKHIIGHKGRGPGEIVRAGNFNFNGQDQLVVNDESQRILKVFNLQDRIVHSAKMDDDRYSLIGGKTFYIYNNKIYAAIVSNKVLGDLKDKAYKSRLAGVYNFNGKIVNTVGRYDPTVRNGTSYNKFSIINLDRLNHTLLSTHQANYRIQMYDLHSGKRLAWFGRQTAHYHPGDEYIAKYLSKQQIMDKSVGLSVAISVHATKKYILLYFETLTKAFFQTKDLNKKKPYVAVYNRKTRDCYGEIKLPYILGHVAGGKLYLIEDTNPDHYTVGVYEIQQG